MGIFIEHVINTINFTNMSIKNFIVFCKKEFCKTLNEYPQINIDIIGRIATEGLNVRKDNEISKKRGPR